jgi:NAD(P)-dependent dehydrogenase (short-subunit alcohol dehydrogenase family)
MSSLNASQSPSTRVALVTGAAQGIGRAIALRLAADGLDVAVDDLPSKLELLEEVVNEIKAMGRKTIALTFDISQEDEVKAMVEQTVSELGRLDAVNCCT